MFGQMSSLANSALVSVSSGLLAAAEKEQGFADPDLVLWSFLIFALLLVLLRQFAWGPICEALDKREAAIKNDLEQAKLSAEKAREAQATYEAKLAAAAQEANHIVATAREEAVNTKSKLLADAHEEAESVRQRGLADVEAARRAVVNDLAQASVDQAVGLAGKLIKRTLDKNAHSELISESVNNFGQSRT
jgi:F-type H+-transporting ATPase subunit b